MTWRRTWTRSLSTRCSWWPSPTFTTCCPPYRSTCWPTASPSSHGSPTPHQRQSFCSSTHHWCSPSPRACWIKHLYWCSMRTAIAVWSLPLKVSRNLLLFLIMPLIMVVHLYIIRLAVHVYSWILVFRILVSQIPCICQNNLIVPKIYPLPNQVSGIKIYI